jgi:hypothetical protein
MNEKGESSLGEKVDEKEVETSWRKFYFIDYCLPKK